MRSSFCFASDVLGIPRVIHIDRSFVAKALDKQLVTDRDFFAWVCRSERSIVKQAEIVLSTLPSPYHEIRLR